MPQNVILPEVRNMSAIERSEAAMRVALGSPEKMKAWLQASKRTWLIFNAPQMVDALPWPDGVHALMQIVAAYRDLRSTIPTGDTENIDGVSVRKYHGETLTVPEMDRCIRDLIGQITEMDPTWSLERDPA